MLFKTIFSHLNYFTTFFAFAVVPVIIDTAPSSIGKQKPNCNWNTATSPMSSRQREKQKSANQRKVWKKKGTVRRPTNKTLENAPSQAVVAAHQQRLYQRITRNKKLTVPDLTNIPTSVSIRLKLIKIQNLVEQSELIVTTVRIQIGWKDQRLKWEPAEFGGIEAIIMPAYAVWKPDLAIINSVRDLYTVVQDSRFQVKVLHTGKVWWHPTGVVTTFCRLHLSYFPFDRQKCPIVIESPAYDERFLHIHLRANRTPVDVRMYVESGSWDLVKTFGTSQLMKASRTTFFSRVEFWIILDRTRLYHSINFILPSFVLSAIQVVFFFLPVSHPQRVGSTTVTLLSVMVFQNMIVAQLPKTSESVPLLSIYIELVILVSSTTVCSSVFLALCQYNDDHNRSIPKWLLFCCAGFFRKKPASTKGSSVQAVSQPNNQCLSSKSFRQVQSRSCPSLKNAHKSVYETRPREELLEANLQVMDTPGNENLPEETNEVEKRFLQQVRENLFRRRLTYSTDSPDIELQQAIEDFRVKQTKEDETDLTWLDLVKVIDRIFGWVCTLSITLGPIILFGIIPNFVEHQDLPEPVGHNFVVQKGHTN